MSQVFEEASLEWQPVRPDVTHGVFGRTLLAEDVKVVLTRVASGGEFKMHRDTCGHLFYFPSGDGLVRVNDQEFRAEPGVIAHVMPGEPHGYANTGSGDLTLLSLNLPAQSKDY